MEMIDPIQAKPRSRRADCLPALRNIGPSPPTQIIVGREIKLAIARQFEPISSFLTPCTTGTNLDPPTVSTSLCRFSIVSLYLRVSFAYGLDGRPASPERCKDQRGCA